MNSSTISTGSEPVPEANIAEKANANAALKKQFRWKGKIVKESINKQRLAMSELCKKRKKPAVPEEPKIPVKGRRIVDLQLLAKHLQCASCKEILSLKNTKSETRRGLASIFHVRCNNCLLVNFVPTSGRNLCGNNSKSKFYEVNSEFVQGSVQTGIDRNCLNKLLRCINIPQVQGNLFQRYKQESPQVTVVSATENLREANSSVDAATVIV